MRLTWTVIYMHLIAWCMRLTTRVYGVFISICYFTTCMHATFIVQLLTLGACEGYELCHSLRYFHRAAGLCMNISTTIRFHSSFESVHRTPHWRPSLHFWNSVKSMKGLARQWLAIWLVDFANKLYFVRAVYDDNLAYTFAEHSLTVKTNQKQVLNDEECARWF